MQDYELRVAFSDFVVKTTCLIDLILLCYIYALVVSHYVSIVVCKV